MIRLALALAAALSLAPQAAPLPRLGMTAPEARALLGEPLAVSRQILANRCLEQWHYRALRLSFDCPRGQRPRLVAVAALPSRR